MAQLTDARIRFDDSFDEVIDDLRKLPYFSDLASVALFCAALGYSSRTKFEKARGNRDVRAHVLNNVTGGSILSDALGLIELPDLQDPLSEENLVKRIQIFQEYANGGLQILSEMRKNGQLLASAIPRLITEAIQTRGETN